MTKKEKFIFKDKIKEILKGNITEENVGYSPEELYKKINSCYDDAVKASEKLS